MQEEKDPLEVKTGKEILERYKMEEVYYAVDAAKKKYSRARR